MNCSNKFQATGDGRRGFSHAATSPPPPPPRPTRGTTTTSLQPQPAVGARRGAQQRPRPPRCRPHPRRLPPTAHLTATRDAPPLTPRPSFRCRLRRRRPPQCGHPWLGGSASWRWDPPCGSDRQRRRWLRRAGTAAAEGAGAAGVWIQRPCPAAPPPAAARTQLLHLDATARSTPPRCGALLPRLRCRVARHRPPTFSSCPASHCQPPLHSLKSPASSSFAACSYPSAARGAETSPLSPTGAQYSRRRAEAAPRRGRRETPVAERRWGLASQIGRAHV